jgi:lipopolysaccharide transport system ATP-binding protein
MADTVIRVENLGKKYMIAHQQNEGYTTLRDTLAKGVKSLFSSFQNRKSKLQTPKSEEFWALKDISFEIKQGDRVGIIGRNGAGKSTLLKVLSRITEPTSGRIHIKGRVASLLEVGTGFHPELTGRENIYLNGAILGMSKAEIKQKFDEIVAFAEVEKFLDTPVKRYSSGMYVRLAFAVAAHLEPEILIVDEVLAVGDAQFQKKCLGKMRDVGREGRTVLFVSHNMAAIESLCDRGMLLSYGNLSVDGTSVQATKSYLKDAYKYAQDSSLELRKDRNGNGKVKTCSFEVFNFEGEKVASLQSGKDYYFKIGYTNNLNYKLDDVVISLDIYDDYDNRILLFRTSFTKDNLSFKPGRGVVFCGVRNFPLATGQYRCSIFISHADRETLDLLTDAALLTVDGGDFFGTGCIGLPSHCKVLVKSFWSSDLPPVNKMISNQNQ